MKRPTMRNRTEIEAHRAGGREVGLGDNSMAAVASAVAAQIPVIEIDIRWLPSLATSKGAWVLAHDRPTAPCVEYNRRLPRLEDVLQSFPDQRFDLDVKTVRQLPALVPLLSELGALDRVVVSGLHDLRPTSPMRALPSAVARCTTFTEVLGLVAAFATGASPRMTATHVKVPSSFPVPIPAGFGTWLTEAGRRLHVYNVDSSSIGRWTDCGASVIGTDTPRALMAALANSVQIDRPVPAATAPSLALSIL